jgi:Group II intron, maturase-specific domain
MELLNSVLRDWIGYFAIGHSSRFFSFIKDWVEKNARRHVGRSSKLQGFGWTRWSRQWLYGTVELFKGYCVNYAARRKRCQHGRSNKLARNPARKSSGGRPSATFDAAGTGCGMVEIRRHSQTKERATENTNFNLHRRPVLDPASAGRRSSMAYAYSTMSRPSIRFPFGMPTSQCNPAFGRAHSSRAALPADLSFYPPSRGHRGHCRFPRH